MVCLGNFHGKIFLVLLNLKMQWLLSVGEVLVQDSPVSEFFRNF